MNRLRLPLASLLLCVLAACASTPGPAAAPPAPAPAQASTAAAAAAAAAEVEHGAATAAAMETIPAHAPLAASSQAVDAQPQAEPGLVAEPGIATGPVAASTGQAATEAEDDYAALYGEAAPADDGAPVRPAYDPWEPLNRRIHAFNNVVDRAVARPLASAYVAVVPQPMRLGVTNFFDNLSSPRTFVNQLLQGRPRHAFQTLGRFVVNSTLGIGGIFDPASDLKM